MRFVIWYNFFAAIFSAYTIIKILNLFPKWSWKFGALALSLFLISSGVLNHLKVVASKVTRVSASFPYILMFSWADDQFAQSISEEGSIVGYDNVLFGADSMSGINVKPRRFRHAVLNVDKCTLGRRFYATTYFVLTPKIFNSAPRLYNSSVECCKRILLDIPFVIKGDIQFILIDPIRTRLGHHIRDAYIRSALLWVEPSGVENYATRFPPIIGDGVFIYNVYFCKKGFCY
jgi:hypothetical protein